MALGCASITQSDAARLVTIGTPWDFSKLEGSARTLAAMSHQLPLADWIAASGEVFGLVPVELFQTLFAMIDPRQASRKFTRLADMDPASDAAHHFVTVEDWLTDGVPVSPKVAHEVLIEWYQRNAPASGNWTLAGSNLVTADLSNPSLHVCGSRDTIATPTSAAALAKALSNGTLRMVDTGHVGLVVGSGMSRQVARPVAEFLLHQ
jgi:polyhydroxyalkanoate synthase